MVEHWNAARDGAFSEDAMRCKLEGLGYRVACYVYPPGTVFSPHQHAVDKLDGVVSGRFRITIGGEAHLLEAGDWIAVPRGAMHSAEVVGDAPVVSLDAIAR